MTRCMRSNYQVLRVRLGGSQWMQRTLLVVLALTLFIGVTRADVISLWASDPVGPDETALVVGSGFSETSAHVERLADNPDALFEPDQSAEVNLQQISRTSLKFTIPKNFAPGVYRFRYENMTQDFNAASIYWVQGDQGAKSSPGGWLRIFGRNIRRTSGAVLKLASTETKSEIALKSDGGSLWDSSFAIPSTLATGTYQLRIWNGNGDASSWRSAGNWRIERQVSASKPQLNARELGARGDGIQDDTNALITGLKRLALEGGGTLWLPKGYYKLSAALLLPRGVRLRGEDRKLVRLIWTDFVDPPHALIEGVSDFSIEDVSIDANNHAHVIAGGFQLGSNSSSVDAGNIAIRRVTIRASMYRGHIKPDQAISRFKAALAFSTGGPDTIRLSGQNLVVEDCDVFGSGRSLYLLRPQSARIQRSKFYNGRGGWYSISGADGVLFENNEVIGGDLQSNGGSINTLGAEVFAQNVAFFHNRFSMMNGGDREAITTDGPGGCYFGHVRTVGNDQRLLELIDLKSDQDLLKCTGGGLFLLGGRGMGQVRQVHSVDGRTVLLEEPFSIQPDSSSIASLTNLQRQYLIVGNHFSDAGIAVQLFGASVAHVVAGNTSVRTGGFLNRGLLYRQFQPTWFNQFLSNRIEEGDSVKDAILGTVGSQKVPNSAPLSLATIFRSNVLEAGSHIEVKGYSKEAPGVQDVIIEGNSIAEPSRPIIIDDGAIGVFVRNNSLGGNKSPKQ